VFQFENIPLSDIHNLLFKLCCFFEWFIGYFTFKGIFIIFIFKVWYKFKHSFGSWYNWNLLTKFKKRCRKIVKKVVKQPNECLYILDNDYVWLAMVEFSPRGRLKKICSPCREIDSIRISSFFHFFPQKQKLPWIFFVKISFDPFSIYRQTNFQP